MTSDVLTPYRSPDPSPSDRAGETTVGRVVLVDPRPERRAVMQFLVERSPSLTVVGSAVSAADAEAQIRAERAGIAIVEIQMPVSEGLATVGALRERFPELRIIVCSFHDDPTTRDAARRQGADGYLAKPLRVQDLLALLDGLPRPGAHPDPGGGAGEQPA